MRFDSRPATCVLAATVSMLVPCAILAQPSPPAPGSGATPGGTITGKVVAATDGTPVIGATVGTFAGSERRTVETGEGGAFTLTDLPAGRYRLFAERNGFAQGAYGASEPGEPTRMVHLREGERAEGIVIRLERWAVITGRVTDPKGEPVVGAMVSAVRKRSMNGAPMLMGFSRGERTDDRGLYRLSGIPRGTYYIQIKVFPNYQTGQVMLGSGSGSVDTFHPDAVDIDHAREIAVAPGDEIGGIDVSVSPVPRLAIAGTVVDSKGQRPSRLAWMLSRDEGSRFAMRTGSTGMAMQPGTFETSEIAGRYRLTLRTLPSDGSRPEWASINVTVDTEPIKDLQVTTAPMAMISGRLVVAGDSRDPSTDAPPRGMRVSTTPAEGGPQQAMEMAMPAMGDMPGTVEADGTFKLYVAPGRFFLSAMTMSANPLVVREVSIDGRDVTRTPFDLIAGQTITSARVVMGAGAALAGQVSGAGTGDALVVVFSEDPALWKLGNRFIRAERSDPRGGYEVAALAPGSYFAVAVDMLSNGEWTDPAWLERAASVAARVTVVDPRITLNLARVRFP